MFKIEGKDYSNYLTDQEMKLVRTYKGEIARTQTGVVAAFPTSFVTVGFDLKLLGPRTVINEIERLFLSYDILEIGIEYGGVDILGKFSMTSNSSIELRDKNEKSKELSLSIVSDGSKITDKTGTGFWVKKDGTTLVTGLGFATIYTVSGGGKLNGAKLPGNKILILGNTELTS